jgi:adenylate cyclase
MKASLRSFGRYVPTQLVQEVLATGQEARLGGQNRWLSLYFSDIEGFTRISEAMEPGELVEHLGEYLQAMTSIIQEQDGVVDKFIGDGILALFGAPRAVPDHAAEACRAALRSQACLRELATRWQSRGKPLLRARIGLHTGEVIVGNIGTPERFEYTVMGDAVNLASRLEGLNKVYGTYIMGSQAIREAAGPELEWRTLDRVTVVGRSGGTLVGELLGERGGTDAAILAARDRYERALEAYFALDFAAAADGFRAASAARPGDRAAAVLAIRAGELRQSPPPADWDGVYRATSK